MKKFWGKYKYYIGSFILVSVLFLVNYKPTTYLLGWDSVATDLHPWLGIKRAFFAVWQEYQSFGLVSGMAHASDLFRSIFIWLISFFLPPNLIRYFYHFLMILLGSFGVLTLLKGFGISGEFAFLGSIFYVLNFGTVQLFFFPYEAFSHFFASLPWLIWVWFINIGQIKKTGNEGKKSLVFFFLINLLSTPSFYVQTLFVVYLMIIGSIFLGTIWITGSMQKVGKILVLFAIVIAINSFWLLPQFYFLKTSIYNVTEAKINQMSNGIVHNQTLSRSNITDFLTLKGFYFDLGVENNQSYFQIWQNFFNQPYSKIIQIIVLLIIFVGLFQKNLAKKYFLIFLILIMIFFLSNVPYFKELNLILRKNRIIDQIFRNPFTKFISLHALILSYFFSLGLSKLKFNKVNSYLIAILVLFFSLPSFLGYFISPTTKVKIPEEYFMLFKYFKSADKNQRIALFPNYTYWGWYFNNWGYNGSGFIWYGIEQPIVSRTFDVWSEKSESFFWEMKQAIIQKNQNLFNLVLEKYKINYLILDYSQRPVAATFKSLGFDSLKQLLENNKQFTQTAKFGKIELYQTTKDKKPSYLKSSLLNTEPQVKLTNEDTAFFEFGDYQINKKLKADIYYPFLNFQSFNNLKNKDWQIIENGKSIKIEAIIPENIFEKYQLDKDKEVTDFELIIDNRLSTINIRPVAKLNKEKINIDYEKISLLPNNFTLNASNSCSNSVNYDIKKNSDGSLFLSSTDASKICFGYHLDYLPQKYSYLVKVISRRLEGDPLYFYIFDKTNQQAIIEDRLLNDINYYIIPPLHQFGLGYALNFENTSYKNIGSKNILYDIDIYPLPYQFLKSLKLIRRNIIQLPKAKSEISVDAEKLYYFLYKLQITNLKNLTDITLILTQAFSTGWKAYLISSQNWLNTYFPFLFGQEIKDHVLVNNWANGWRLDNEIMKRWNNGTIILIFWPQYLEFLGFGLIILTLIILIWYNPAIKISNKKDKFYVA